MVMQAAIRKLDDRAAIWRLHGSRVEGETRITTEVAGDPRDLMTPRRLKVLDPICTELTHLLEGALGKGRSSAASLPARHPRPVGQVPVEEVRCEQCGRMVALLVFAEGATDDGRFYRPANILQVWPQRAPIEPASSQVKARDNAERLIRLLRKHPQPTTVAVGQQLTH
jgi:hypothetical protein